MNLMTAARRRWDGTFTVDEWGYDEDFSGLVHPLLDVRYEVDVVGDFDVLREGPALVVVNQTVGLSEPFVAVAAVHDAVGRALRWAGVLDVPLLSGPMRRFGAVLPERTELASVLRAGHLVGAGSGRMLRRPGRAGKPTEVAMGAAVDAGAPVIPMALVGTEIKRQWRVLVGAPVAAPHPGRSPLALAEYAEAVRAGVQDLMDETS